MSIRIGSAIAVLLLLVACTRRHSVQLDATQPKILKLQSRHGEFVSGITLRVTGRLDGTALVVVNGGAPHELAGLVDWKTHELLEVSHCVVLYTPRDVRTGELTVDYFFH